MFSSLLTLLHRNRTGRRRTHSLAFSLLFIASLYWLGPQASAQYLFNEMVGNRNSMAQGMAPGYLASPTDSTWAIAQGDFNQDGRMDIAVVLLVQCPLPTYPSVANCWVIQTYLGQPDGTYAVSSTLSTGTAYDPGPGGALAVGDVNGDGIPDIVFATSGASPPQKLITCIGKGDGTFQTPVFMTLPEGNPFSLALGDFNGDGKLDAVIGDASANEVYLHLGNGDGTFSAGTANAVSQLPQQVLVADMNRDGKLDIVASESNQIVSVLLGNGDGTFAPELPFNSPGSNDFHIAVGDLNGDGVPDVVVSGNQINVFLGNGDGTLQAPISTSAYGGNPGPVITGDFNGDGITDIATGGGWTGVMVLFGNNDGTFRTPGPVYGNLGNPYPSTIAAGDYNNDGKLDIATAPYYQGLGEAFSILVNNGDGTFGVGGDLAAGSNPTSVVTADFNGDGIPDFAIASATTNANGYTGVLVYLGTGRGQYGTPQAFSVTNGSLAPLDVVAGDFNRDGKIDLATLNYDGSVSVLLGAGDGTFAAQVAYTGVPSGQSPLQLATGDLNHDGALDLVILRSPDGNASVLLGNGDGSFQAPYTVNTGTNGALSLQVADVNRDGNLDLLVNGVNGYLLQLLTGNGDGTFQAGTSALPLENAQGQANPGPSSFGVADLRGNGILDVITADSSGMYVWPGNGDGTFGQPIQNYGVAGQGTHLVFGDFNGDGKTDVAMCGDNDAVWVSLGNGDDTFGPQLMYDIPRTGGNYSCAAIVAGDFNGDGSLDVAGLNNTGNGSLTLMLSNPVVAFSSSKLGFGAVNVGSPSAPTSVRLTNQSSTTLKISSVAITGTNLGDFAQTNTCGATLAAGANCALTVTFTPTAAGTRTAAVTFTDNSGAGIQNITLTGAGTETSPAYPVITWPSPTPIVYGDALSAGQLNATANVPGTFTYTPALNAVLPAGTQTLSLTFTPASTNYTTATATVTLTVTPAASAVSLASSPNPSTSGQAVILTATVAPQFGGTATGTVTFQDGAATLGTSAVAGNRATFSTNTLTAGTHSITATYSGDANVLAATSGALPQTVTTSSLGQPVQFQGLITTVAGNGTTGYNGDNIAATGAELYSPAGVAIDSAGNLYIADIGNNRVRKVTPAGVITTVAGNGVAGYNGDNIPATSASLYGPIGVAIDSSGNLYIAEQNNERIRKVTASGVITTVAGNGVAGYNGDNIPATSASLDDPFDVAVDSFGNLYIADYYNYRVRKVTASGVITTVAGNGIGDYFYGTNIPATSASLFPSSVTIDIGGNLYIADSTNDLVRKVTPAGLMTTVAGTGVVGYNGDNIPAVSANLDRPNGVAVDKAGNLYISDPLNGRIRMVTPAGVITTVTGNGVLGYNGDNVPATSANLNQAHGIAVDDAGHIYIADIGNDRIRKVQTSAINFGSTNVGQVGATLPVGFTFNTNLQIGSVAVLTQGASGKDYQAATSTTCTASSYSSGSSCTVNVTFSPLAPGLRNGAVVLYDTSTPANALATVYLYGTGTGPQIGFGPGVITSVAGDGTQGYSGDGGQAISAELAGPTGIVTDGMGNLYFSDSGNSLVRMISPSGTITTVAGMISGGAGLPCSGTDSLGNGCPATQVSLNPQGLAIDGAGNLYIAANQVYQMTPGGILYHLAGTSGPGSCTPSSQTTCPATSVQLYAEGVAADVQGNVFIADMTDNQVYKITPAGVLSVFAGTGALGYSGDGGPAASAQLYGPSALAIDPLGNIYIADQLNNVVRMVAAGTGTISTVAGNGVAGLSGDGGPAVSAELSWPTDIKIDAAGSLVIVDKRNGLIRKVAPGGNISTLANVGSYLVQNLALDSLANLYVTDPASNVIRKIDFADPPVLSFPSTSVGSVSAAQNVAIENSGNAPLNVSQIAISANFSLGGTNTSCVSSGQLLPAGSNCILGLEFAPTMAGNPISGALVLTDNTPAASHSITLSGTSQATNPSITWSAPAAVTYGTALSSTQLNATANVPGIFVYTPALGTIMPAGTQTLSVTFTPTSTSYTPATTTVSLVVNPAPLTITASSATVPYGSAAPVITAGFSGFVNGDSGASLPAQPTCTTAYTTTSTAGSSPATICSGAAATNYAITYVNGAVTVIRATPVINWTFPAAINYGTPLGAMQLNATFGGVAGTATYSPASGTVLGAGDQTLQVTFAPTDTTDYNVPVAATVLILVNKVPLTVTAQNSSKIYGAPLPALAYALTGFVNGDTSAAVTGTPGLSTSATSTSPAGTYPISAAVGSLGAANYSFVTANGTLTVTQAGSTVSISSNANPASTGQAVTFTATVAPQFGATATGTVTFKDGASVLGTSAVAGNNATFSTSALSAGSHSITASYSGDTNVLASTSAALSQTVNGSTNSTAIILESNINPAYVSQAVTYTAVVTSPGGIPGGNLTFRQGATTLAVVPLVSGAATFTTTYGSPGSHSITAEYSGSASFTASTSTVLTEVIKTLPAATTTVLTLTSGSPTFVGQMVTLTATVSSNYIPVPNGELVSFTSGGTVIGTAPVSFGAAVLNISTLPVGTHSIRARYSGDTFLTNSTSAPVSVVISRYPTTSTATSNLNPSAFGNGVVFSASVASTGSNTPTGTVTFKDGTNNIGTVTLTGGTASLSKTNLAAGTHSITVVYNGDAQNAPATSAPLAQVVNAVATTTAIRSSLNPSKAGQSLRFTAAVTSASGATPTGTVTFVAGPNILGTVTLAGGSASISTSSIPSGATLVTATYNGNTNMTGSSASVTQTVH